MKIEKLQKYIQHLGPELYSFAYVLIPDDLQASQLMIDSVQSYLIQKRTFIERMTQSKNKMIQNFLDEAKLQILKIIFELSRKRYQQLKISFQEVELAGGFFSLEFDEKAVLYLKDKGGLDLSRIEYVTSSTRAVVLSQLFVARVKITGLTPHQIHQKSMVNEGIA
jgi:hypothetical protein